MCRCRQRRVGSKAVGGMLCVLGSFHGQNATAACNGRTWAGPLPWPRLRGRKWRNLGWKSLGLGQRGQSKWLWDRGAYQSGYGTEGPIKVAMGQRGQSKWLWDRGANQSGYGTEGPIKVAMGQRGLSKWLWDRGANQSGYGPSICVLCCHMGLVSGVVDRISKQPKNDLSALG